MEKENEGIFAKIGGLAGQILMENVMNPGYGKILYSALQLFVQLDKY